MESQESSSRAELIAKRDLHLPSIISSLMSEQLIVNKLEKLQICIDYLPTFDLKEVEEKLFKFIMPEMKKSLLKLFEDNFVLFKTAEEDFVVEIIKQNLKMTSKFMEIEKAILEFILLNEDVNVRQVYSVPVNSAEMIKVAFQHCKKSPESYQNSLSAELLEVFHSTKEVHASFLNIMENILRIEEYDKNNLLEVLDILCSVNAFLCEMNMKSLLLNWKSYTRIAQKYSDLLKGHLNLKRTFVCLNDNIERNFKLLKNDNVVDHNYLSQTVKVTSFLLEVAMRLFDTFWDVLDRNAKELVQFFCIVYQYIPERLGALGYTENHFNLFVSNKLDLNKLMQPLLCRLTSCTLGEQVLHSLKDAPNQYCCGSLYFLNGILKFVVASETGCNLKVDELIEEIFSQVNLAHAELIYDCSIYDELVLTIASAILTSSCYSKVEYILLKNLFGESSWNSILAIEIWCLLLSTSPAQFRLETIQGLVELSLKLNFGKYTKRVEEVYLKCLLRKLFQTLPPNFKKCLLDTYPFSTNKYVWRLIGVDQLNREDSNCFIADCLKEEEHLLQVENLELLSTVNFDEVDEANAKRLAEIVSSFWETVDSCPRNNAFRYFANGLCKLTGQINLHFSNKQLLNILTQLRSLCTDVTFRQAVCDCLRRFSSRICNDNTQDIKTSALTSDIVSTLLKSDNVIRRNVLEFIRALMAGGKQDLVNVIRNHNKDIQSDVNDYSTGNYEMIANFRFRHECVQWKTSTVKKFKLDEVPDTQKKEMRAKPVSAKVDSPLQQQQQQGDTVSDVIRNIRGEVKCLMDVLKSEKLTAKNASDLRTVTNQLLSIMN